MLLVKTDNSVTFHTVVLPGNRKEPDSHIVCQVVKSEMDCLLSRGCRTSRVGQGYHILKEKHYLRSRMLLPIRETGTGAWEPGNETIPDFADSPGFCLL